MGQTTVSRVLLWYERESLSWPQYNGSSVGGSRSRRQTTIDLTACSVRERQGCFCYP